MSQTLRIASDGSAEIALYGNIAETDVAEIKGKLERLAPKAIRVRINSDGGQFFAGLAIYNLLVGYRHGVTTVVDGRAASAASLVAMAGRPITMAAGSFMLLHHPWTETAGNAAQLRDTASSLDGFARSMAEIYARRSGQTLSKIEQIMSAETWLSAEAARALGLCDFVTDGAVSAKRRDGLSDQAIAGIWAKWNSHKR